MQEHLMYGFSMLEIRKIRFFRFSMSFTQKLHRSKKNVGIFILHFYLKSTNKKFNKKVFLKFGSSFFTILQGRLGTCTLSCYVTPFTEDCITFFLWNNFSSQRWISPWLGTYSKKHTKSTFLFLFGIWIKSKKKCSHCLFWYRAWLLSETLLKIEKTWFIDFQKWKIVCKKMLFDEKYFYLFFDI